MTSMSALGHELPPHFPLGCPLSPKSCRDARWPWRLPRASGRSQLPLQPVELMVRAGGHNDLANDVNFLQKLYEYDPRCPGLTKFLSDEYCYDGCFEKHG
jgi:hypothetical protein